MNKLVIVGNTSNARLAHYYFTHDSDFEVCAFSADGDYIVEEIFCGLEVVPLEDMKKRFPPDEYAAFVAVGYSKMNDIRKDLYERVASIGYRLPNYISSRCSFLTNEEIGDNNLILEDNTIQPFVKIGSNNVFWSGNHIGHDVSIGDHNFITSHVVVSGFTRIENNVFLGVNSTLRDDITIGEYALIGAGASIMRDAEPYGAYFAPKARKLDKKSTELTIS